MPEAEDQPVLDRDAEWSVVRKQSWRSPADLPINRSQACAETFAQVPESLLDTIDDDKHPSIHCPHILSLKSFKIQDKS